MFAQSNLEKMTKPLFKKKKAENLTNDILNATAQFLMIIRSVPHIFVKTYLAYSEFLNR
jgi:hypothetical protein